MSRTRKGAKGPTCEVDRKREGKRGWRSPGATAKKIAHRAEREAGKRAAVPLGFASIEARASCALDRDPDCGTHSFDDGCPGGHRGSAGEGGET